MVKKAKFGVSTYVEKSKKDWKAQKYGQARKRHYKNIVVKADEYKKEHIKQQKDPRHNQW